MQPEENVQNDATVANGTPGAAPVVVPIAAAEAPKKDNMFENTPKKSNGMLIGLILCVIAAVAGIGFGVWEMMDGTAQKEQLNAQISTLRAQNSELLEELEKKSGNANDSAKYCEGTYYGELSETATYKYVLNGDGTFSADLGGVSGKTGFYMINGNTISLIGTRELGGPEDIVTQYITSDYIVADDCSYIKIVDGETTLLLNKQ